MAFDPWPYMHELSSPGFLAGRVPSIRAVNESNKWQRRGLIRCANSPWAEKVEWPIQRTRTLQGYWNPVGKIMLLVIKQKVQICLAHHSRGESVDVNSLCFPLKHDPKGCPPCLRLHSEQGWDVFFCFFGRNLAGVGIPRVVHCITRRGPVITPAEVFSFPVKLPTNIESDWDLCG